MSRRFARILHFSFATIVLSILTVFCTVGIATANCYRQNLIIDPGSSFPPNSTWRLCSGMLISFQGDGNLVVYDHNSKPIFDTKTSNLGATRMSFQGDGNLVIYAGDTPLWASNTHGHPNTKLAIQSDGNIVIYEGATPIFSSNTWIKQISDTTAAADKVYCHTDMFIFKDGTWRSRTLFSNGTKRGADLISTITVTGPQSFSTQHEVSLESERHCDGSCEGAKETSGFLDIGKLGDTNSYRALATCAYRAKDVATPPWGESVGKNCVKLENETTRWKVSNQCSFGVVAQLSPMKDGKPYPFAGYTNCILPNDYAYASIPVSSPGLYHFELIEVRKCAN